MELISLASFSRSQDDAKGGANNMVLAWVDTSFSFKDQQQDPSAEGYSHVHSLRIFDEDYDQLQPGVFLNDTLIDFWFQWYALCIVVVNHYVVYHFH
jgi:Ulp1 family protease